MPTASTRPLAIARMPKTGAAKTRVPRPRSFPKISEALQRYSHGTHARYVLARCRCERCREANRNYEVERQAKRRPPYHLKYSPSGKLWVVRKGSNGEIAFRARTKAVAQRHADKLNAEHTSSTELIPVDDVIRHVRWLQDAGIGIKTLSRASTVSGSVINRMLDGDIKRTRRSTAAKILRVGPDAVKSGARMLADETLVLIDQLVAAGYTRMWIARQLGLRSQGLQIARTGWVSIKSARRIHALYVKTASRDPQLLQAPPFRLGEVESSMARFRGKDAAVGSAKEHVRPHGTASRARAGCRCKACARASRVAAEARAKRRGLRYVLQHSPTATKWAVVDSFTGATVYRSIFQDDAVQVRLGLNSSDPASAAKMYVCGGPVRAHLTQLIGAGTGPTVIAKAAGISSATVMALLHERTRRTTAQTAQRILALKPGELPPGGRIDAAPSWLLLQRLQAAGFQRSWIAEMLKRPASAFAQRTRSIALAQARDLVVLYDALRDRVSTLRELEQLEKAAG